MRPARALIVLVLLGPGVAGADPGNEKVRDRDGDAVPDSRDRCPEIAGLPPDGCPPVDTDGDRVADRDDACPQEAGPPPNRGCPDKDSDGDRVIDRLDDCPVVMGPADLAGCPPDDRDDDAVPDRSDRCPDEPEVWNGRRDTDGCRDAGKALVTVGQGQARLARYPRFTDGDEALRSVDRSMIRTAARAIRSARAGAISLEVVAEYGLSYGDSIQRARRRARVLREALIEETKLPPEVVRARALGPDGNRRVVITYR